MKRTPLLLSLLAFACADVMAMDPPTALVTSEAKRPDVAGLLEVIDGFIPRLEANKNYTEALLNYMSGITSTSTKDKDKDKGEELKKFIDEYMSLPPNILTDIMVRDEKKKPKAAALELFQRHSNDLVSSMYLLHILKDLRWALTDAEAGLENIHIQSVLNKLLWTVACFNQANCNEIAVLIPQGLKAKNLLFSPQTFEANSKLTLNMSRVEYIDWAETYIDKIFGTPGIMEIDNLRQLALFYLDLETRLRPFVGQLPAKFDKQIPTGPDDEKTIASKVNDLIGDQTELFTAAILGFSLTRAVNGNLNGRQMPKKAKNAALQQKASNWLLTEVDITQFIAKNYTAPLNENVLLTGEEKEAYPPLSEKRRKALMAERLKKIQKDRAERSKKALRQRLAAEENLISNVELPPSTAPEEVKPLPTETAPQLPPQAEAVLPEGQVGTVEPVTAATEPEPEVVEEWVDYWTWFRGQNFASRQETPGNTAATVPAPMQSPTLTGRGEAFFSAVFGQGAHNVTRRDFNDFLRQVGGQKWRETRQGLRSVPLDDAAVECVYTIPDLTNLGQARLFRVHQPHGNDAFLMNTLRNFLQPQLISAGYGQR